jgi:predicted acetyltransferase
MPELVVPTVRLHKAWLEAHDDWGPGFAAWAARLIEEPDRTEPVPTGEVRGMCRWIVEDDRVLGIALRYGIIDFVLRHGHVGYGMRPSARMRGLATWAPLRDTTRRGSSGWTGTRERCGRFY